MSNVRRSIKCRECGKEMKVTTTKNQAKAECANCKRIVKIK